MQVQPPLKIDLLEFGNGQIDTRFFNANKSPHELTETILPTANLVKLQNNDDKFKNFDVSKRI